MAVGSKREKQRLDGILVSRGLAPSREQAGRLILAGAVRVDGVRVDKRARLVDPHASIEVITAPFPYVSRGGAKLAAALDVWNISCHGQVGLDVGASTGGFTDCLLQRGVARVYAVDVGYGQLAWSIRQDPRVVVLERQNIRYLPLSTIPEPVTIAVVDVSFISLTLVIPCVVKFLAPRAVLIALVKPQFEVGVQHVGRGGIVRDAGLREQAAQRVRHCAEALGFRPIGMMESPICGKKGNRELLLGFLWEGGSPSQECHAPA
ncbi:MAG: TlyA family RNA methyltransferase [Nitrospirae bacterium]|nr:MAG: TlyA family RNA methyltransferase [Nitrospirota bacterium]